MSKILEQALERIDQKKKLLVAKGPLSKLLESNLYEWSKIALTYTSNAIEGNTLTEGETALIVEKGITVGGKTVVEHLEALGHAKSVDFIRDLSLRKKRSDISLEDILDIHKNLLERIFLEYAGKFRQMPVRVSGSAVPRPNFLKVPSLIENLIVSLQTSKEHEVKIAADLHLDFVFIHPFIDGNGRTARLLFNLILLQAGYPLAKVDNKVRSNYINAIEKALLESDKEAYYLVMFQSVEEALDVYLEPDILG